MQVQKLQKDLERYLTWKTGFEAGMTIRCTESSIHPLHGNVHSVNFLSPVPSVNPGVG